MRTGPIRGGGTLVLALLLALCVVAVPTGATAASPDDVTITVEQGEDCYEIDPLGNGDETVEGFYDYDTSYNYSSNGTTHLQDNQVSNLLVYHGSEGYSLVLVHDKYGDAPYGGVTSMTFTGLPTDGEWAVEDDGYDGRDDQWNHQGSTSEVDWMWYENRNDGGAFRGLTASENVSITVDPAFNEEAATWGEWDASGNENDRIEEWRLYTGPDETTTLDMNQSVTISNSGCDAPPSAALTAQPETAAVDESVTLNASDATDDEGIAGYGWDFDGDGTIDLNTTTPTADYTYDSTGDYEATVTVRDYANNTDTATTTVTITEDGGDSGDGDEENGDDGDGNDGDSGDGADGPDDTPMAALTGPTETTVGETVALDASASSDGDGIASYGWNFDGDTTVDRTTVEPTVETSFDESGTHTVTVTVKDENGNTATAEHTIEVGATDEGPTGEIVAPAEATVGESVTIEATSLSDGVTHVCWYFDGETGPEGQTVTHTFEETGTHEVTLELRDEQGRKTTVATEIDVVADDHDGDSGDENDGSEDGDSDDGSEDDSDDSDENDGSDEDDSDESDGADGDDDESDDGSDGAGVGDVNINPDVPNPLDLRNDRGDSANDSTNDTATDSAVSVGDVRTSRETVDAGSQVEITVDFDGADNETEQVPLTVHQQRANGTDGVVDELPVAIPENGTGTASVATTVERPGEYFATIGNRTAAFSVMAAAPNGTDEPPVTEPGPTAAEPADDPADSTDAADDTTTSANGPGFGTVVAALGLVLSGLLAARRRAS
ncbi:PKD domain-containing protein [Halorientalis sp. IM1011]|uniref:PKD domain-containing protein n=1 Tax=Halorientalis sp. IM1011 TaxID=1932360 RepID=UPI0015606A3C|nr:PKD domain-containing protein [Halorientalis sp. IM1011]